MGGLGNRDWEVKVIKGGMVIGGNDIVELGNEDRVIWDGGSAKSQKI